MSELTTTENKKTIAVIYGGKSSEHNISCLSAQSVLKHIDRTKYEVIPVGIAIDGTWFLTEPMEISMTDNKMARVVPSTRKLLPPVLPEFNSQLIELDNTNRIVTTHYVDVFFPLLHGLYGEDGTIQGLFELYGLNYVGANVLASGIAMDKSVAKKIFNYLNINTAKYIQLDPNLVELTDDQKAYIGLPLIVKPARGGSSMGISKVDKWEDFPSAVLLAREEDSKILVEQMIMGKEIECAVLQLSENKFIAATPGEVVIDSTDTKDIYTYESKYLHETNTQIPAQISKKQQEQIKTIALKVVQELEISGLARVDFFVTATDIYINELNTIPGFTEISLYPKMWLNEGIDYKTLINLLIESGLTKNYKS